jgi:putative FmdB family regulatory protein
MPVYEYACTECGRRLEVRQNFTDEPLTTCEVCGGRLRKLLSAVGVVFKGPGFYRTDSRGAPPSEGGSGQPGSGESGSEKGTAKEAPTSASNKEKDRASSRSTGGGGSGGSASSTAAASSA